MDISVLFSGCRNHLSYKRTTDWSSYASCKFHPNLLHRTLGFVSLVWWQWSGTLSDAEKRVISTSSQHWPHQEETDTAFHQKGHQFIYDSALDKPKPCTIAFHPTSCIQVTKTTTTKKKKECRAHRPVCRSVSDLTHSNHTNSRHHQVTYLLYHQRREYQMRILLRVCSYRTWNSLTAELRDTITGKLETKLETYSYKEIFSNH